MRFYVGVTDDSWFEFLAARRPDEVNFWRPGGRGFHAIEPGAPFLFKLHAPNNFIVGGGFFVRHSILPLSLAWSAFAEKNGCASLADLRARILKLRRSAETDPHIGCTILTAPFFLDRAEWIPIPSDWHSNIVSGRGYDNQDAIGAGLWAQLQDQLLHKASATDASSQMAADALRYGSEYLMRNRLGQGAFRVLVTDAYTRRCAMTGERTLPVLEACHIRPYTEEGPHTLTNGLLLRSDLHILFDRGYLTVTPDDYTIEVSGRIREEFSNGREYYALHGTNLKVLPPNTDERPSTEFLSWHNEHRFAS